MGKIIDQYEREYANHTGSIFNNSTTNARVHGENVKNKQKLSHFTKNRTLHKQIENDVNIS